MKVHIVEQHMSMFKKNIYNNFMSVSSRTFTLNNSEVVHNFNAIIFSSTVPSSWITVEVDSSLNNPTYTITIDDHNSTVPSNYSFNVQYEYDDYEGYHHMDFTSSIYVNVIGGEEIYNLSAGQVIEYIQFLNDFNTIKMTDDGLQLNNGTAYLTITNDLDLIYKWGNENKYITIFSNGQFANTAVADDGTVWDVAHLTLSFKGVPGTVGSNEFTRSSYTGHAWCVIYDNEAH